MQQEALPAHLDRTVAIDLCEPCQLFWFDAQESVRLTPAATLTLFRIIGERIARPVPSNRSIAKCPRCRARLRRTHDMQRNTRFEYLKCPHEHGRLTTFFDFLREKNFIRPLTPRQIDEIRRNLQSVNCSNCGGPVDLVNRTACAHCGTPLSMLDLQQAEALVDQLQRADQREGERAAAPIDPALPLELARARREVEDAFAGIPGTWFDTAASSDLIETGLKAVARWLKRS